MVRNYLAAALRNLARNRLYATINIIGLSVGFAAAILIGLFLRHELTFDRFIPGYENVYRLRMQLIVPNGPGTNASDDARGWIPELLKLEFPQIEAMTRVAHVFGGVSLRHGDVETLEDRFYWADSNFFEVLPLRVIAGDIKTALTRPDGLVLTRRMARKYFGSDTPLGETLEVDRKTTLTVTAVLADLPSNTHLNTELFGSGVSRDGPEGVFAQRAYVYLRLSPAGVESLRAAMPDFIDRHFPSPAALGKTSDVSKYQLVNLGDIHLYPAAAFAMTPVADPRTLRAIALIGALILLVASINFVNLMTARAARRAVEVGIRKVSGSGRSHLILQFIGESLIYALLGTIIALALVELLLPRLNAFLDRDIVLSYTDAPLLTGIVALVLSVGTLAGAYPALVLSAFRPAAVLKGGPVPATGSGRVREMLVVLQFAILIGLILATAIVYRQTAFGLQQGLRFDDDQLLAIETPPYACEVAPFRTAVESLPGVRSTACSMNFLNNFGTGPYIAPDGREVFLQSSLIGAGLFELLGLKPVAGRFFERGRLVDAIPPLKDIVVGTPYHVVINETAVRQLGFASPSDAIGKLILFKAGGDRREIIGVVPDFSRDSVRRPIEAMYYENSAGWFTQLNVKLKGSEIPETLKAIDKLWDLTANQPRPISRAFYQQYVQDLYRDLTQQSRLFAYLSAVALFLAGLGLFGLAAFTAERRTREIGVRKALGAESRDILRLLLWQFSKPVLWATLLAWPVAAWIMHRWLQGFAYHTDLAPWLFVAATAIALCIALVTVTTHSLLVARARPVMALRHE
jgi:putative ABC transport system permease protein